MSPLNESPPGKKVQALIDEHVREVADPKVHGEPMVSVVIWAYNHLPYLPEALASVEMQQVDFPLEIVVTDDCSTDGTTELLREYQRAHPDKVRLLLADRNLFHPGPGIPPGATPLAGLVAARGKYIALLDGDDYWTDPEKLRIQVDLLESDSTLAGCFHNSVVVDESGNTTDPSYFKMEEPRYSQHDCLTTLASQEATGSLVFRARCLETLPEWYVIRATDQYLDLLITEQGDLGYIPRNMSAYRKHEEGMWSGTDATAQTLELWFRYKLLLGYPGIAEKHEKTIEERLFQFEQMLFTTHGLQLQIERFASLEEAVQSTAGRVGTLEAESREVERRIAVLEETSREMIRVYNGLGSAVAELGGKATDLGGKAERLSSKVTELIGKAEDSESRLGSAERDLGKSFGVSFRRLLSALGRRLKRLFAKKGR